MTHSFRENVVDLSVETVEKPLLHEKLPIFGNHNTADTPSIGASWAISVRQFFALPQRLIFSTASLSSIHHTQFYAL